MFKPARALATTLPSGPPHIVAVSSSLLTRRRKAGLLRLWQALVAVIYNSPWSKLASAAVKVSATVLCLAVFFQYTGERNYDPYRCEALIKHGQWPPYDRPEVDVTIVFETFKHLEETGTEPPPARPFDKWEPVGCRMHEYSRDDMMGCLGGQRLLFVGDSSMRQLFFAALARLDHEAADWLLYSIFSEGETQEDVNIEAESVQLDFLWDPWLNSTALKAELAGIPRPILNGTSKGMSAEDDDDDNDDDETVSPAALIVMGAPGLWAARNGGKDYFRLFQEAIDYVEPYLGPYVRPSSSLPASADEERDAAPAPNNVFLAPVLVPRYDVLPDDRMEAMTLDRVQEMNGYLDSLSPGVQSHILTAYNDMTANVPEAYADTGLHVTDGVAERWIDIPLNARCNGWLTQPRDAGDHAKGWASQKTCCVAYPPMMGGQAIFALGLCALVAINALAQFADLRLPCSGALQHASVLVAAVLYCYAADRTHLFAKTEIHENEAAAVAILAATAVVCLASLRRVNSLKGKESGHRWHSNGLSDHHPQWLLPENDLLPRHITDEWKGVAFLVILILTYVDTSESTPAFKWKRLLVGSYLFLSTYGHTTYFLHTGDFSLGRAAAVLFRLNMLPTFASMMLDGGEYSVNNSTLHVNYFPRLVSFWFLVTYATLYVGHRTNESHPARLAGRIGIALALVLVVLVWTRVYNALALASQASLLFFSTEWRAGDMRRAITLDLPAPFLGMLVAVVVQRVALVNYKLSLLYPVPCPADTMPLHQRQKEQQRRVEQFCEFNEKNGVTRLDGILAAVCYPEEHAAQVQAVLVCAGLFVTSAFIYEAHSGEGGGGSDDDRLYHPYISCAVMLAMAVLRTCHAQLRAVHLSLPARVGQFALELSVLQHHVLFSGNGTGHLHTGFWPKPSSDADDTYGKMVASACYRAETSMIAVVLFWVSRRVYMATRILAASFGQARYA